MTKVENVKKTPKKRGRKPKGGKIIKMTLPNTSDNKETQSNIILHLKYLGDDEDKEYPEYMNLNDIQNNTIINEMINNDILDSDSNKAGNKNNRLGKTENFQKSIWDKIKKLKHLLHNNEILDKRSGCFWCTYAFDNPPIYIPKQQKNDITEVYGCFCSPECAVAYLKREPLDTSILWERYALLNNIYSKIYNYTTNIKPAPNPFYTLEKYYGNMTIQEYRTLLNKQYLLIVVDKPLTKIMPELYDDNSDLPNIYSNLLANKCNDQALRLTRKNTFSVKNLF